MTAIRLFATTSNANAPHGEPFPGAMGGQNDGLELDVTLARMLRANVLVVGPEQAVSNALALIIIDVDRALVLDRTAERLRLPIAHRPPTIIIRNVDALTDDEQIELLDWMRVNHDHSRVISTASRPLFGMLDARTFNSALYYCLNTVYVDLTPNDAASANVAEPA